MNDSHINLNKLYPDGSRWLTPIVLATMCAVFTIMYSLTPVCLDDMAFMRYYIDVTDGGKLTFDALCRLIDMVRVEENGRPANIECGIMIMLLPHWLRHLTLGLLTTAMVWAMSALVSSRADNAANLAATWLVATVMLPWRARMFVVDYALNYIPPTLLMLAWLWLFIRRARRLTTTNAIGLIAMGLITGIQHEGMMAPLTFAIGIYAIIKRFRMSGRQWLLIAGAFGGVIILLSAPGLRAKMGATEPPNFRIQQIILGNTAGLAAVAALTVALLVKRWRKSLAKMLQKPIFTISLLMLAASIVINLKLGFSNQRATWYPQVMCVIAIVMMLRSWVKPNIDRWPVAAALTIVTTAFWSAVISGQYHYYKLYHEVAQQVDASPHGTAFVDIDNNPPNHLLRIPLYSIWTEPTHIIAANMLYEPRMISVVPAALSRFSLNDAKNIAGTAGAMNYDGLPLLPDKHLQRIDDHGNSYPSTVTSADFDVVTDDGVSHPAANFTLQRFVAPSGDTMIYMQSTNKHIIPPFAKIDRID